MAENTIDFNPEFNTDVAAELDSRAGANETRGSFFRYWNYQKYCYVNISIIEGRSGTAIKPEISMTIGDSQAPTTGFGPSGDMYTSEGGIIKPKPTISSVKITNQGGEDYTESAIYEVEASFKVYTLDDLEKVEKSFFIIGAQMDVNFGWRNHPTPIDGVTKDSISTNIYNFNFSIESDGSYNCNVKAISEAALFSQTTGGVQTSQKEPGDVDEEETKTDVISQLSKLYRATFGINPNSETSETSVSDGKIERKESAGGTESFGKKLEFYAGNIEDGTPWYNIFKDDSVYVGYIKLGSFIDYLNAFFAQNGNEIKFEFTSGAESKYPVISGFGSADPGKFVLQGEAARYNNPGEKLDWSAVLNDKSNTLESILISIDMIQGFFNELSTDKVSDTISPSITKLLAKIFNEIDINTGGLITPKLIPQNTEASAKTETQIMYIMNRKTIVNASDDFKTPYPFSAIGERSVGVRNITLESDYDSDLLVLASTKAISEGTSNTSKLSTLYPTNTGLNDAITTATTNKGVNTDALKKIKNAKLKFGKDGYTADRISAYRSAMQNYINQFFDVDTNLKNGGYGELPLMLKLSVTIDGVQGIKFLSPITVDRLPKRFKNNNKIAFSVISIEHSFDGQGDWETTLGTVMRIR